MFYYCFTLKNVLQVVVFFQRTTVMFCIRFERVLFSHGGKDCLRTYGLLMDYNHTTVVDKSYIKLNQN